MKKGQLSLAFLAVLLLAELIVAVPYLEQGNEENLEDYNDNLDRLLQTAQNSRSDSLLVKRKDTYPIKLHSQLYKRPRLRRCNSKTRACVKVTRRSCIRRGASCDHRSSDCCYNSSCRCNLWGTNCRCERMGLFQQWGK